MTRPSSKGRQYIRWSVSNADESTIAWVERQDDLSASLRLLVRESIQRDGYIDVVNRPVGQLPRRGRPLKDVSDDSDRQVDHSVSVSGPGESSEDELSSNHEHDSIVPIKSGSIESVSSVSSMMASDTSSRSDIPVDVSHYMSSESQLTSGQIRARQGLASLLNNSVE